MAPPYQLTEDGKFRIVERPDAVSGQTYRFLICDRCGHWIRRRTVTGCTCDVVGCHNSAPASPLPATILKPKPPRAPRERLSAVAPPEIGNSRLRKLAAAVSQAERDLKGATEAEKAVARAADAEKAARDPAEAAEPDEGYEGSPQGFGIGTDQRSASGGLGTLGEFWEHEKAMKEGPHE